MFKAPVIFKCHYCNHTLIYIECNVAVSCMTKNNEKATINQPINRQMSGRKNSRHVYAVLPTYHLHKQPNTSANAERDTGDHRETGVARLAGGSQPTGARLRNALFVSVDREPVRQKYSRLGVGRDRSDTAIDPSPRGRGILQAISTIL